ncbi:MAG: universal stress protein [Desulfobacteraceae bacterium]|nr:MAG: universal stress protein [Desulfobacteraceae bacterium]
MKLMVGYNGSPTAQRALALACKQAKGTAGALVYVVASMEGGSGESLEEIRDVEEKLQWAKDFLLKENVACETLQLARGLSPGEDLVKFAEDNSVDHIFLGIEKKSRTRKILLGSTAQYIILRGPCPVTTTK